MSYISSMFLYPQCHTDRMLLISSRLNRTSPEVSTPNVVSKLDSCVCLKLVVSFSLCRNMSQRNAESKACKQCIAVADLHKEPAADPGFPQGGANSPGGAPTYNFAKFSRKLHEIERIWVPGGEGGGTRPLRPLNPPSAHLFVITDDGFRQ